MLKEVVGKVKCEPVPINKVGDYCEEENNNTNLHVEFNEVRSMAILDSKIGVVCEVPKKITWRSTSLK